MSRNQFIKKAHTVMEYTPYQIQEIRKCRTDPIYFIENYVKIVHPTKGAVNFELYDYQKDLIHNYHINKDVIALSARQSGKSICSSAYILWYTTFKFDKSVLIASNKESSAKGMIKRIRYAYEHLPMWLKQGVVDDGFSKHEIGFENGSSITATATAEDSGRSMSISLLYLDEFAFVAPNIAEEFWSAISPTLACIVGNTRVLTSNGFKKIEDFHRERRIGDYFKIQNLNVWGKEGLEEVSHGYVSPESETLVITTRHGLEIEVTKNHPLYTLNDNSELPKMVSSKDLCIDDHLRIDAGMNVFGNNEIPEDISYMMGGYIAEGWMCKNNNGYHTIYISNNDQDFRDVYINNNIKTFVNNKKDSFFDTKIRCHSKRLVSIFEEYGIDPTQKCYNKTIPEKIFSSSKKTICVFLQGLFDGDGSVGHRSINLTSTSRKLIQEVQLLLLNLGIISAVYKNDAKTILKREIKNKRILPHGKMLQSLRDSWGLNIPLSQYKLFSDLIGFRIERKQKKLEEICQLRKQDSFKQFTVPTKYIKNRIQTIVSDSGKSIAWFRDNGIRLDKCLDNRSDRKTTFNFLSNLKRILLDNKLYVSSDSKRFFDEYLNLPHFWDKIISIKESSNKTYDFTVPKTHSFLQNGILGSNTGGDCIITSTPNGDMNIFAQLWRGADLGINGFFPIEIKWNQPPGRGEKFKKEQIGKIGERQWMQEFECIFLSSDALLINSIVLANETERLRDIKPEFTIHDVDFWKPIEEGETYILGVDPSTGSGEDYSVITGFTFPEMEQVLEFRCNSMSSPYLYNVLKNIIKYIEKEEGSVYFSVENNGVGEGIIALYEADENPPATAEFVSEEGQKRFGFTTTNKTKLRSCVNFKEMFEKINKAPDGREARSMTINSMTLLKELKSFARRSGSYSAQLGATDDSVSAVLIVLRILEEMATFDQDAHDKLHDYHEDDWFPDTGYSENNPDDQPLPIII